MISQIRLYFKYNKMKNNPSFTTIDSKHQQQTRQTQFSTPVTFIWYGPEVPQDYMIRLSSVAYPVQFLKNPHIRRSFKRQLKLIQRADFYRLQYIYQNGGIYSDFDNRIDYKCVGQVLKSYKDSDKVIFWWQPKRNAQTRNVVPNSFIYAPRANMQAMKKILENVNDQNRDLKFAGMQYLAQFANKQLIQVKQLYECIKHQYDFSWVKESGKAEANRGDKQQLTNQKIKKAQILNQLEKAKKQNAELQRQYQILKEKYKETEEKLMRQYKSHYVEEGQLDEQKENTKSEQVKSQMSSQVLRKNSQLTSSITNTDNVKSQNTEKSTKYLGPITSSAYRQEQVTINRNSQARQQYSPATSLYSLSNSYQLPDQSSPVYAGPSMKLIDVQKQVQNLKISDKTPPYKMDGTLRSVFIVGIIAVVLLLILCFILVKFKQYRQYANVHFQLQRKAQSDIRLRTIETHTIQYQSKQIVEQNEMSLQKSKNEQSQVLRRSQ